MMSVSETSAPYERTADGGFLVKRTEDFVIEVSPMIYNWRVHVALPEFYGQTWEKGYCYFGLGLDTLVKALTAAETWAEGDPLTTDPPDFDKRAF
jgi:hypothetical protein